MKLIRLIKAPLRLIKSVTKRYIILLKVYRSISGLTSFDDGILKRSLMRGILTSWNEPGKWQFPIVINDCRVYCKEIGKFHIRANTDDLFHALPMQEPFVEKFIRKLLRVGDTFVDAGANIGYYTILSSKLVGERGKIISIEMIPATAKILRKHIEINYLSNVRVVEGALSKTPRKILKASIIEGKSGKASIIRDNGENQIEVQSLIFKDLLADVSSIRLIKMDLEGAELDALKGLKNEFKRVQAIIFENRGDKEVINFIKSKGFSITRIDSSNILAQKRS